MTDDRMAGTKMPQFIAQTEQATAGERATSMTAAWSKEVVQKIAADIGAEVFAHISTMYPALLQVPDHVRKIRSQQDLQRNHGCGRGKRRWPHRRTSEAAQSLPSKADRRPPQNAKPEPLTTSIVVCSTSLSAVRERPSRAIEGPLAEET